MNNTPIRKITVVLRQPPSCQLNRTYQHRGRAVWHNDPPRLEVEDVTHQNRGLYVYLADNIERVVIVRT